MNLINSTGRSFSTDVGNVSQLVPAIQPLVAIAPANVLIHSPEFAAVAGSEAGISGILVVAKALAMTVVDLLANTEILAKVKEEFRRRKQ